MEKIRRVIFLSPLFIFILLRSSIFIDKASGQVYTVIARETQSAMKGGITGKKIALLFVVLFSLSLSAAVVTASELSPSDIPPEATPYCGSYSHTVTSTHEYYELDGLHTCTIREVYNNTLYSDGFYVWLGSEHLEMRYHSSCGTWPRCFYPYPAQSTKSGENGPKRMVK